MDLVVLLTVLGVCALWVWYLERPGEDRVRRVADALVGAPTDPDSLRWTREEPARWQKGTTGVYVFANERGEVKIGQGDVWTRWAEHQRKAKEVRTVSSQSTRLAWIGWAPTPWPREMEGALHDRFSAERIEVDGAGVEWFRREGDLASWVETLGPLPSREGREGR